MSYLVDTHALRPHHQRREQGLVCTSTLNNVFSEHVLEKKHEHLSSGDELWVSDVENRRTSGPMMSAMSRIGSIPVPDALLRYVDMRPNLDKNRACDFTCFLALPNGNFLCSRDQQVLHFENDFANQNLDFEQDDFHVIVNLQKPYEELRTRTVSIDEDIKGSIRLEMSRNIQMPVRIENITENSNVEVGDLIYKVRGHSVIGKSKEHVYALIKQGSFGRTFELEISRPEACVENSRIKSLFVYPNNSVVFVDGNKLSLRMPGPLKAPNASHDRIRPLAGHETKGYVNGKGAEARFNNPRGVIVNQNNGDVIVADSGNHAIRLIQSDGTVTTLAGAPPPGSMAKVSKGPSKSVSKQELVATAALRRAGLYVDTPPTNPPPEAAGLLASVHNRKNYGFYDETGSLARFNTPTYLAWDKNDSIVVVDAGNHSVRRVTMQGVVSTVAGGGSQVRINRGQSGASDGKGVEARFNNPGSVVVDADGTIVVVDTNNNRLCKIVGDTVTTVASNKTFDDGNYALHVPFFGQCEMTLQRNGTIMIQSRPGRGDWIVVDLKLKEPAWFKMYREGVRRRWLVASCLRLGMLKRADQSNSSIDISEETETNILGVVLRMVVDEPSFLDEHSKGSLLNTVQAFFARRWAEQRALLRKAQLAAPEDNAQ